MESIIRGQMANLSLLLTCVMFGLLLIERRSSLKHILGFVRTIAAGLLRN